LEFAKRKIHLPKTNIKIGLQGSSVKKTPEPDKESGGGSLVGEKAGPDWKSELPARLKKEDVEGENTTSSRCRKQ